MSEKPFDREQLAAIQSFKGAYRVDACAGAGKTTTLVARIAFLRKQGVPENDILALTFTRAAADEMRVRSKTEKETTRTLHSWALAAVKQEVNEFTPRLRPFPLLLNKFEILIPISKHCGVQYKDLDSYISNAKRLGKTPQEMREDSLDNDRAEMMVQGYDQYEAACKRMGVLDFDSIIWELALLLEKKPHVRARHQIPFLMVDEAQDCSTMDWKLIGLITEKYNNIWIVGDFAQSVYGFRGASPQIFASFSELFPGATTLPMGTNYRSQANVVKYSQKVMPEETSYLANWKAHKPATTEPQFWKFDNDVDEAQWVLSNITSGRCELNDTAIIARTNAQLAIMQGFCAEKQIAYKLLGKDNFWKRPEVLGLLGLLKNAIGFDDAGMKQALHSPLPCVRFLRKDQAIEALERIQQGSVSGTNGEPLPLRRLLDRADVGDYRQNQILRDVSAMLDKANRLQNSTPGMIMEFLASQSGAKALGDEDADGNNENFVQDNIRKVVSMAKAFGTVNDLVRFARTAGKPSRKQTRLILSTVHGFKGREAKNVFVIGVNLGTFPHDRADLQEERRLYYVAVSRPTENLFVSCAGAPSPFLEGMIDEEVVAPPVLAVNPLENTPLFGAV